MGEAGGGGPQWQSFAAQVAETFLEASDFVAGLPVAPWNGAAGGGIAALEGDFADAEAHHAALVFAVELIFPERGQVSVCARSLQGFSAIDFERGAKALAHGVEGQAREPIAHCLQRRRGNNRWAVGDAVVGKAFGRVTDQDLLLEIDAEPFRGVFGAAREGKCARRDVAAIAGNRERDGTEVRRVRGANQVHRRSALAVHPAAVDGEERPGAVVLESTAGADARLGHGDRVERLDGMQANPREPRRNGLDVSLHVEIVAHAETYSAHSRSSGLPFRLRLFFSNGKNDCRNSRHALGVPDKTLRPKNRA